MKHEYLNITEFLLRYVRERPGMYLGTNEISKLPNFIIGYSVSNNLQPENKDLYFDNGGFLEWYEEKYKPKQSSFWCDWFTNESNGDERLALKLYFEKLEEFYLEKYKPDLINIEYIELSRKFIELNQLKKDILWIYSFNTGELNCAFVADNSFDLKYWEYLSFDKKRNLIKDEEERFYLNGCLVILLCYLIEYLDTTGGNQKIFQETKLIEIIEILNHFESMNADQLRLKEILIDGYNLANSMTESELRNSDGFEHPEKEKLFGELKWIDRTFIKSYFKEMIER